jgi:hypothetical protein
VTMKHLVILFVTYVSSSKCGTSGCICYSRLPRVDCNNGRSDILPKLTKMFTEVIVFDNVAEGSLDNLDFKLWPSLTKVLFTHASQYVCKWLEKDPVPLHVDVVSMCSLQHKTSARMLTVIDNDSTSETVTFAIRGRLIVFGTESPDLTTETLGSENTTEKGYSVDVSFNGEVLLVTVVIPITFVICASLTIYIKWKYTERSNLKLSWKLKKKQKMPRSPPPEAEEPFAFDNGLLSGMEGKWSYICFLCENINKMFIYIFRSYNI